MAKKFLSLPKGPDLILVKAVEFLDLFWDRSDYVLGGGTALAARWNHRHSADVDLFMENDRFQSVYSVYSTEIRSRLEENKKVGSVHQFSCGDDAVAINFVPTESMTLVSTLSLTDEPLTNEYEQQTEVRLESTAEILAKKVYVRMNWRGNYPARDVYDLVVAKYLDPVACDKALGSINESERIRIAELMEKDIETRSVDPKQIERARYPDIENHLWELGVDLLAGRELPRDLFSQEN